MLTLIEREQRLTALLRTLFPDHRVTPTLQQHADARRTAMAAVPEIRVLPAALQGNGILQWKLEFAQAALSTEAARRLGNAGFLRSCQELRDASHGFGEAFPYRLAGGRMMRRVDGVDLWEETLEESWTPAGSCPQALFAEAKDYAAVAGGIEQGQRDFLLAGAPANSPPPDAPFMAAAVETSQFAFLGTRDGTPPMISMSLPAPIDMQPVVALLWMRGGVMAPESAIEEEEHDTGRWRSVEQTLEGRRRTRVLKAPSYRLRLHFPLMPQGAIRAWQDFLDSRGDRSNLLLVRRDQRVVDVVLEELRCELPSTGEAGSLTLVFEAAPVRWLPAFGVPEGP